MCYIFNYFFVYVMGVCVVDIIMMIMFKLVLVEMFFLKCGVRDF